MRNAFRHLVGVLFTAFAVVLFLAGPITVFVLGVLMVVAMPLLLALLAFGGTWLWIKDSITGRR